MATALDVIRRAMRIIGALAEGEVPTAEQSADALLSMQAMLGEWETRGVRLGSLVDATLANATTIPLPPTHLNAIAFNLAVVMAPEYGRGADALQTVIPQAERSFDALLNQYAHVPVVSVDPALVQQSSLTNRPGDLDWWGGNSTDGALWGDTGAIYP